MVPERARDHASRGTSRRPLQWVAYVSNESGGLEVFVLPFAGGAEPIRVSKAGGGGPEWHANGNELFFLSPANRLMSVPVTVTAGTFTAGTPVPLFPVNSRLKPAVQVLVTDDRAYASVDRFLVAENEADPRASTIHLQLNWTGATRR